MSKRGKQGAEPEVAEQPQLSLVDLPLTALALVKEHSKPEDPLLGLSRGCRDAVLSHSKKISLKITSNQSSSVAPTARLLNRACCTAPAGLHLDLDLFGHDGILAPLLQPALLQREGWPNVHELTVHAETSSYLYLLSSVMPALHHLRVKLNHLRVKLNKGDLGDGAFLSSLQLCSQLTALHLERISVSESTAMAAAAALARLPNLRELSLKTDGYSTVGPSALVQHLTALTSLRMHKASPDGSSAPMYAAAARNPGLLSFSVSKLEELNAPAAQVQQLLEACPSLTHLNLQNTCIQQDTVDVLLAHGTSITSLSAYRIQPSTSIADRQVSWRKLVLTDEDHPTVQHLANLPLQSLTSLQLSVDPDVRLGLLELPTSSVPAADLPGLLLQATTNLAKCPAWRSKPDPWLMLRDDSVDEPPADASFTPEQRLQLFQALAPLGGPHVRIFALYIEGFDMELGRAEVAALGQSFGKGLEELQLSHVTLAAGFWAALDNALPSLKGLVLEEEVTCSAADIGIYCGRRTTASRFVVLMSPSIYKRCGGQQLRKGLQAQGLSHISVHKYEQ